MKPLALIGMFLTRGQKVFLFSLFLDGIKTHKIKSKNEYHQISFIVMFYKAIANTDFANSEPLFLKEIQG